MYIIIAGGGLIGKGLAKKLVEGKHDVVLIDIDPVVCESIYASYGAVVINGNATELETLESAKIDKADIVVGVLKNDSDNLAFALLARHFNVKQILVKMNNSRYESIYKTAGVTNIARASEVIIDQLFVNIESAELRKVIGFGNLEICIINVPEKSKYIEKTIKELLETSGFPKEVNICCIFKEETNSFCIPHSESKILSKDRLFVCGTHDKIKRIAVLLQSKKNFGRKN